MQAAVLGTALTILYMIAYYRLLGGLAAVALLLGCCRSPCCWRCVPP